MSETTACSGRRAMALAPDPPFRRFAHERHAEVSQVLQRRRPRGWGMIHCQDNVRINAVHLSPLIYLDIASLPGSSDQIRLIRTILCGMCLNHPTCN